MSIKKYLCAHAPVRVAHVHPVTMHVCYTVLLSLSLFFLPSPLLSLRSLSVVPSVQRCTVETSEQIRAMRHATPSRQIAFQSENVGLHIRECKSKILYASERFVVRCTDIRQHERKKRENECLISFFSSTKWTILNFEFRLQIDSSNHLSPQLHPAHSERATNKRDIFNFTFLIRYLSCFLLKINRGRQGREREREREREKERCIFVEIWI